MNYRFNKKCNIYIIRAILVSDTNIYIFIFIGSIQYVETGSLADNNGDTTFAIIFDLYSVLLCFQHMHGNQSFMSMDGTMFGQQPKIGVPKGTQAEMTDSRLVHDSNANFGYLTVLYWLVHDQNNTQRMDSQNKGCIPTCEFLFHNNLKSGVRATLMEQASAAFMFLIQRAWNIAQKSMRGPNIPKILGFRYVEADNGQTERLHNAKVFGRDARLLRERWHTEMIAYRFISELTNAHVLTEHQSHLLKANIVDFCNASSPRVASKVEGRFRESIRDIFRDIQLSASDKAKHAAKLESTIGTSLFKTPIEVCNYGRKDCQAITVAAGPMSETLNSASKGRLLGKCIF